MSKLMRKLVYFTERLASFVGLRNLRRMRPTPDFPHYVNSEFLGLFDLYKEKTMVSWQGMYDAFNAAQHVKNNQINGDIVECVVWQGGVSALMRDVIEYGGVNLQRQYWLYDTYEGMSPPSNSDFKFGSNKSNAVKKFDALLRKDGGNDWCRSEIDEVRQTMSISGFPQTNVKN